MTGDEHTGSSARTPKRFGSGGRHRSARPLSRQDGPHGRHVAAEFEDAVRDALDEIPDELAAMMDNVVVLVEDAPPDDEPDLLGLYEGTPLTERGEFWAAGSLPDRITIFRLPDAGRLRQPRGRGRGGRRHRRARDRAPLRHRRRAAARAGLGLTRGTRPLPLDRGAGSSRPAPRGARPHARRARGRGGRRAGVRVVRADRRRRAHAHRRRRGRSGARRHRARRPARDRRPHVRLAARRDPRRPGERPGHRGRRDRRDRRRDRGGSSRPARSRPG